MALAGKLDLGLSRVLLVLRHVTGTDTAKVSANRTFCFFSHWSVQIDSIFIGNAWRMACEGLPVLSNVSCIVGLRDYFYHYFISRA